LIAIANIPALSFSIVESGSGVFEDMAESTLSYDPDGSVTGKAGLYMGNFPTSTGGHDCEPSVVAERRLRISSCKDLFDNGIFPLYFQGGSSYDANPLSIWGGQFGLGMSLPVDGADPHSKKGIWELFSSSTMDVYYPYNILGIGSSNNLPLRLNPNGGTHWPDFNRYDGYFSATTSTYDSSQGSYESISKAEKLCRVYYDYPISVSDWRALKQCMFELLLVRVCKDVVELTHFQAPRRLALCIYTIHDMFVNNVGGAYDGLIVSDTVTMPVTYAMRWSSTTPGKLNPGFNKGEKVITTVFYGGDTIPGGTVKISQPSELYRFRGTIPGNVGAISGVDDGDIPFVFILSAMPYLRSAIYYAKIKDDAAALSCTGTNQSNACLDYALISAIATCAEKCFTTGIGSMPGNNINNADTKYYDQTLPFLLGTGSTYSAKKNEATVFPSKFCQIPQVMINHRGTLPCSQWPHYRWPYNGGGWPSFPEDIVYASPFDPDTCSAPTSNGCLAFFGVDSSTNAVLVIRSYADATLDASSVSDKYPGLSISTEGGSVKATYSVDVTKPSGDIEPSLVLMLPPSAVQTVNISCVDGMSVGWYSGYTGSDVVLYVNYTYTKLGDGVEFLPSISDTVTYDGSACIANIPCRIPLSCFYETCSFTLSTYPFSGCPSTSAPVTFTLKDECYTCDLGNETDTTETWDPWSGGCFILCLGFPDWGVALTLVFVLLFIVGMILLCALLPCPRPKKE